MKTTLVVLGGLLFAQASYASTGAAGSIDTPDKQAPAAPPALLDPPRDQPPKTLPVETVAPKKLRPTGDPPPRRLDHSKPGDEPLASRLVPVRPLAGGTPPREILRQTLVSPQTEALGGMHVTLLGVLAGTRSALQQAALIDAYWDLSAAVANYHIALDGQRRLKQIVATSDGDRALIEVALAEARVGVQEAHLAAVEAQHRLAVQRPLRAGDVLPLPADPPHVGAYRTRFESIFAGQPAPQARRLNDTLPILHEAIRARASAVASSRKLLSLRLASYEAGGRVDLAQVLAIHARLSQQRRRFVAAVRQYNLRIAEYAGIVAPEGTDGAQLVAMLIKVKVDHHSTKPLAKPSDGLRSVLIQRPPTTTEPQGDTSTGAVEQVSGEEPNEPSEASSSPFEAKTDRKVPRDGFVPRRTPPKP